MTAHNVTVSDSLYDDLGMGEAGFQVRFAHDVLDDSDVPDEVGLAMRRAVERFFAVSSNGRETEAEGEHHIEAIIGPFVDEGGLSIFLDTDDRGATREMVAAIGRILVEELAPTGVEAFVDIALGVPSDFPPAWKSSDVRE